MRKINCIITGLLVTVVMIGGLATLRAARKTPGRSHVSMTVGNFTSVTSDIVCRIEYTQSSGPCTMRVEGSPELVPHVRGRVSGKRLVLSVDDEFRDRRNIDSADVVVRISSPSLEYVAVSGVGNLSFSGVRLDRMEVNATGVVGVDVKDSEIRDFRVTMSGVGDAKITNLKGENLSLLLPGVGNIYLDKGNVTALTANLSGVGNMTLSGKAGDATLTCSGMGTLDASDLRGKDVEATATGMGNITCHALSSILASAPSSYGGSVTYYGNPSQVSVSGNVVNGGK